MKLSAFLLLLLVTAAIGSLGEELLIALCRLAFVVFATLAATLGSGFLFYRPSPIPLQPEIQRRDVRKDK